MYLVKEKWALGVTIIVIVNLLFANISILVLARTEILNDQQKALSSKNRSSIEQLTIYYKKSGGLNGTDIRILYNSDIKELVFVDVVHGIIKYQEPLTQVGEYNLTKPIIDNRFFQTKINHDNQSIKDKALGSGNFLYGLSISLNNATHTIYWTDKTKDADNLIVISRELEKIANAIYG